MTATEHVTPRGATARRPAHHGAGQWNPGRPQEGQTRLDNSADPHLAPGYAAARPGAVQLPGGISFPRLVAAPGRGRIAARLLLPAADVLGLAAAGAIAGQSELPTALYALAFVALLAGTGQQRPRICLRSSDQAGRVLAAAALALPLVLAWLPAAGSLRLGLWSAGLVAAARAAACAALRAAHRRGWLTERALVVGAGTSGAHVADLMRAHPELGLVPQGFLDDGPPRRDLGLPTLGRLAQLPAVVSELRISRIVICPAACPDEDLVTVLRACGRLPADICMVPRLYEVGAAIPRASLDEIWGIPLVPMRNAGMSPIGRWVKRAFDLVVSAVLLAFALPVLAVFGVMIKWRAAAGPLFRQVRVTGAGRRAMILKLRTLAVHDNPDTAWAVPMDGCIPFGRFLRSTHLDELPQLVNVLRGDMSLVGPRPERPYFAERYGREVPRYPDRDRMPAGLTGWAQVHGLHGDTSIAERARFDSQYIEYWTPWLDVVILCRTIARAAGRTGGRR